MDFLWHKVSVEEKEEIRKQAKAVMDKFSKRLEKINLPKEEIKEIKDSGKDFERVEGTGKRVEFDKKIMFENAPKKNKDFIISEKKEW